MSQRQGKRRGRPVIWYCQVGPGCAEWLADDPGGTHCGASKAVNRCPIAQRYGLGRRAEADRRGSEVS